MSFDLVVIGAGPAGITAATNVAKAGHKVLIIDKKDHAEIGSMLGGGVVKLETFAATGFKRSTGSELISFLDTFELFSPTAKTFKKTPYSGIVVDRVLMIQRMLEDAKAVGVEVKSSVEVASLNIEYDRGAGFDRVTGVTTDTGESINSKIVIDAAGISRKLIKDLPDSFKIEKEIKEGHIARTYVELLPKPEKTSSLTAYLAVSKGYVWRTPTEIGYGSLDPKVDLKKTLHDFMSKHFNVTTDPNKSGYGILPIRQNSSNMVGHGFLVVGDAAFMTNPMEGTGIASGMIGAKIAAEVVNKCLEKNDVSQNALWEFNVKYSRNQGANLAYMDMLRRGLTDLPPDDIDFAFEKDVVTSKDVLDSITGDITNVSNLDKAQRAFRGIRRPHILLRLESCMHKSKDIKAHYLNYPETMAGFDSWVKKLDTINSSFA